MKGSLRLLTPHLGARWSILGTAALSTIFLVAADLARPFPLKLVIDHLVQRSTASGAPTAGADFTVVAAAAALVLAVALVDALATYQMELRLREAGEKATHGLRVAIYAHLQRLSLSFHERARHGDLVTRATGDVHAVGLLFSESIGVVFSSALLLLGMVVVSFAIDPLLALATLSAAPALFLLTVRFRRRIKAAAREQRTKEGEIASLATETLSAMREVKALGLEHFERERLQSRSEERQEAGLAASRLESRFAGIADVIGALGAGAVLVLGVFRVSAGAVSLGDLVVMASYARRVHRPLRDLVRQAGRIARSRARAERIAEVLAADEVLPERPDAFRGPRARGSVEMEAITFTYAPGRPVLRNLSLSVAAGERVALLGRSGAGKSTIAALLARFYDPRSGRVLVDGRDLRDCALSWTRSQVGLVLQDSVLFTGTVAENVAYGTDAGRRQVMAAAKAAGAHSFICELPAGYDTLVGARGLTLSGGQRQRIGIARTLLRDPPILVLDEPTAALDAESEAEVLAGLDALMKGRTVILITHSPALARTADRVLLLKGGRPIEDGRQGDVALLFSEDGETTAAPPPRSRPPEISPVQDPALPQMPKLLNEEDMADVLQRSLGSEVSLDRVRFRYLRYKPATNLVVHYEARLADQTCEATVMIAARNYLERRAAKEENLALARLVEGRSPAPFPLAYDSATQCLIQWYPLDIALPVLAEPPLRLGRLIAAAGTGVTGSSSEPTNMAYKPRRRAVLRFNGNVVKCYANEKDFVSAAAGLEASSRQHLVIAPRYEGMLPSRLLTVQSFLPGRPVDPLDVAGEAGEILSGLRGSSARTDVIDMLRRRGPIQQLGSAAASARLVAEVAPALRFRLERFLRQLEDGMPDSGRPVPAHGDFNARQILLVGGQLALTDFDEFCLASPALDPATYAAYVVGADPTDLDAAAAALDALFEECGPRPPETNWYLATMILRRAPRPFRYLEPEWPRRIEGMIDAAEEALHL
jgi:ATP-binding cassette, subfamily B, bacterial